MRYEILGPLQVIHDSQVLQPKARKINTLLTILILRINQVVTTEQIFAELWPTKMPRRANAAIHVYISQLRRFLWGNGNRGHIQTSAGGYMLSKGSAEVDVDLFEQDVRAGQEHIRREAYELAAEAFESALARCRGPVLSDLRESPSISTFVAWFEEAKLACTEYLIDATIALGRAPHTIPELYALTEAHPLRERFHQQLMLALYLADRRADALRVYQNARQTLVDELGLEPGNALRELQHAILLGDARLERPGVMLVSGVS
ncbi:AfsR/SARP family transcriptional regulator [Dactylosporangium sp. CA-233914]|uniref:AfsR/SARP family transcriptional regulator n=1 Tax=Dactylosporangium sp. CA-233914 TaxID=3239934 RepID=UPI003D949CCC